MPSEWADDRFGASTQGHPSDQTQVGRLVCVQPKALVAEAGGSPPSLGAVSPEARGRGCQVNGPLPAPLLGQRVQPATTARPVFACAHPVPGPEKSSRSSTAHQPRTPSQARSCSEACGSYDRTRPVENILLCKGLCLHMYH